MEVGTHRVELRWCTNDNFAHLRRAARPMVVCLTQSQTKSLLDIWSDHENCCFDYLCFIQDPLAWCDRGGCDPVSFLGVSSRLLPLRGAFFLGATPSQDRLSVYTMQDVAMWDIRQPTIDISYSPCFIDT
jgi:hypothetical protein